MTAGTSDEKNAEKSQTFSPKPAKNAAAAREEWTEMNDRYDADRRPEEVRGEYTKPTPADRLEHVSR